MLVVWRWVLGVFGTDGKICVDFATTALKQRDAASTMLQISLITPLLAPNDFASMSIW